MNAHEAKLKRMVGMSPGQRVIMNMKLSQFSDWNVVCKKCGERRYGSVNDLLKSSCECQDVK